MNMAEVWVGEEFLDNETGEKNWGQGLIQTMSTDAETGEPEIKERILIKTSKVPLADLHQQEKLSKKSKPPRKTTHGYYWRKQEMRTKIVKEFVIFKKRNVTPFVFMLPAFFICPAWASILCLLGEACMHIWSHKRNRKKRNANVEYRSPLHLISSHFCVHCRSQKWMEKISKIQDKRYFKRKIMYPNFRRAVP